MSTTDADQLARLLGIPLFQTPLFLPRYRDGEWGTWRIRHVSTALSHGYYTGRWLISGVPVLLRRDSLESDHWETWMSLTPHEIESQEPACSFAAGHTVIMGLGMGWIAMNVALNPSVSQVTVVEIDADVIDLFTETGILEQAPAEVGEKIDIVHEDALKWRTRRSVEFLFVDIWPTLGQPSALEDVQCVQRHTPAEAVYFWGQELVLHACFRRRFGARAPLTLEGLRECASEDIKLPLLLPWGTEYVGRIDAAVQNRRDRGLMVDGAA